MVNWGEGGKGAAGGAMTGATLGSAFGPLGTGLGAAAGGILGGLGGLFGSDGNEYSSQLQGYADYTRNREAPWMGKPTTSAYSDFRGNQADLIAMLEAQARGEGPSLAAEQLRAATDRNQRQAQSLAAGARGPNAALAQFQAQAGNAQMAQQAAQDAALGRIQEQMNAQQQLGLTIHGARGADEATNMFNANAWNERDLANLRAKLETMGMNDQATLQALLGASGAKSPGTGTQILAGGVNQLGGWLGARAAGTQGGGTAQAPAPGGGGYGGWGQFMQQVGQRYPSGGGQGQAPASPAIPPWVSGLKPGSGILGGGGF